MALTKYPTFSGSSSYGLQLDAAFGANSKGSYSQIVASTPEEARGLIVEVVSGGFSNRQFLIDIATGGSGSETVVVSNLPYASGNNNTTNQWSVFIPLSIPASTRLSARCQCPNALDAVNIAVTMVGGTSSATATTYGAVSSGASRGTEIDPGGSAHTKGSYVELTSATSSALDWLLVFITGMGNNNPSENALFSLDIATGGSGSETVVVPDLTFASNSSGDWGPMAWAVPVSIASGTRIAARGACSTTDATDRLFSALVVGITNSGLNGGGGGGTAGYSRGRVVNG